MDIVKAGILILILFQGWLNKFPYSVVKSQDDCLIYIKILSSNHHLHIYVLTLIEIGSEIIGNLNDISQDSK